MLHCNVFWRSSSRFHLQPIGCWVRDLKSSDAYHEYRLGTEVDLKSHSSKTWFCIFLVFTYSLNISKSECYGECGIGLKNVTTMCLRDHDGSLVRLELCGIDKENLNMTEVCQLPNECKEGIKAFIFRQIDVFFWRQYNELQMTIYMNEKFTV